MVGKKRTYQGLELPEGIQVRGNRLHINFTWCGEQQQFSLKLEATEKNIAWAGGLIQTVRREIELNIFEWEKHFPQHPLARKKLALPETYSIADLLDDYIVQAEQDLAGTTWDNDSFAINTILKPVFGDIPVNDFTPGYVRQWIKQQKHLTKATLQKYLSPLRSALREAVLDEKIEQNPLTNFIWPKESQKAQQAHREKQEESGDLDPFNQAEIAAIIAATDRPQEQHIIRFGFWSGLRLEQLFTVQWQDVDFINNTIRIQRALIKRKGYKCNGQRTTSRIEIKGLKTSGKGVRKRDLVLMPEALKALKAQKQYTFLAGQWIFHHALNNTHWRGTDQFYMRWKAILHKAGVRFRMPYQMRHTWASMLLSKGEDVAWVSKMLGHVNTDMVRKTYHRFIPSGEGSGYQFRQNWELEDDPNAEKKLV